MKEKMNMEIERMTEEELQEQMERKILDTRKLNKWGRMILKEMEENPLKQMELEELIYTNQIEEYLLKKQERAMDELHDITMSLLQQTDTSKMSPLELIQFNYQVGKQAEEIVISELFS